ncbi:DnaA regulatory inactivator Hda [Vibrio stylophorae]|uniref:DnaA regulatory inactivator Hda n=1 Tax=Vibrio stylophorae TaxID=659351 RepID=A0ABN8DV68_9VIBR|nr:DnaA inactivator Hda [Vibrio stylophorae]CAH0534184.1 DnaA regulatory inactivator Hda [Vibrio stylophorae]
MTKHAQLSLNVLLPDDETFASFYAAQNQTVIDAVQACASGSGNPLLYLFGPQGAGRTHLLHAACAQATQADRQASYIPLEKYAQLSPSILDGLENLSLVCLDNIDAIAGESVWEEAIFDLYNRIVEKRRAHLLVSGRQSPKHLGLALPDLISRLDWSTNYKLAPLSDSEKLAAMQHRAHLRGFELTDEVGQFLLKRLSRDMRTLFETLDQLDLASIEAKRKLTIPFVKSALSL